tara:strand:+ start:192956 stop:193585 length:630 start_codon:yes stop_codon:yes gene_type:complete
MAQSVVFWNLFSKTYSKQKISDQKAYEYKLQKTRALMKPTDHVFEFGCGTGSTAIYHAEKVKSIHATDYAKGMIEIANSKLENGGPENVKFQVGTFDSLNLEANSYDMVLGLNILHLIPNMSATIEKIAQITKPGGYFIGSTACLKPTGMYKFKWLFDGLAFLGILPKVYFFSSEELASALEENGFTIIENSTPGSGPEVRFTIAQKNS